MITAKPLKPRVCTVCKTSFTPQRIGAKVCSPYCAMTFARSARAKAQKVALVKDKRETKAKLDSLKTRGQWIAAAQIAFNGYIRARDAGQPCICCGRTKDSSAIGGAWDAGHYRSRGSAPHLRFDERNVHAQLKYCNRYQAGNIAGYRLGLIERIGIDALDALEADQAPRKHTIDELKAIKTTYTAKAKQLKAQA